MTRSADDVERAVSLYCWGANISEISRLVSVSRPAVRDWLSQDPYDLIERRRLAGHTTHGCDGSCEWRDRVPPDAYAYLLAQYLGDGCIARVAKQVDKLRITCDQRYIAILDAVANAVEAAIPNPVGFVQREGCIDVVSYSKHWQCLLPQHGPGRKHLRPIVLEEWQLDIVDAHPWAFLKGLLHSEGSRCINKVTRHLKDGPKVYLYSRWFFCNESKDIRALFTRTCDQLGIAWTVDGPKNISIARRADCDLLDLMVGPKA